MNSAFYSIINQWVALLVAHGFVNSKNDTYTFKLHKNDHIMPIFIRTSGKLRLIKQSIQDKRDMGLYLTSYVDYGPI